VNVILSDALAVSVLLET